MEQVINGADTIRDKGPGQVSPFAIPALSGSMAAAQVSMKLRHHRAGHDPGRGLRIGRDRVPGRAAPDRARASATSCSPAARRRRSCAMAFAALANMTALSKRNDDPAGASRPFDRTRDGFVFGEGAGILVVESAQHALDRGATILAEIVGAALTADAYHISAPEPTGRGASMAMTECDAPRRSSRRTRSTTSWPTARPRRSTT